MLLKKIWFLPLILLAACFVSPVQAQIPTGPYIEANVGYGYIDETINDQKSASRGGFGYNLNLGYQFIEYFALEAGYTKFPNQKYVGGPGNITIHGDKNYALALAAKVTVPIQRFDVFAKLGPALANHHLDAGAAGYTVIDGGNHFLPAVTYGGGVDYNITNHWAVNIQANGTTSYFDKLPHMYLLSTGLKFTL